jgi:hypothetical protein
MLRDFTKRQGAGHKPVTPPQEPCCAPDQDPDCSGLELPCEERQILERAAALGGCLAVEGLSPEEMVHAASMVLTLQTHGLLIVRIAFNGTKQPQQIGAELTDEGRKWLAAARSPPC